MNLNRDELLRAEALPLTGVNVHFCEPVLLFCFFSGAKKTNGAQRRNRTTDTGIFSPLLYRLSYLGKLKMAEREGFEPSWACTLTVFKTAPL